MFDDLALMRFSQNIHKNNNNKIKGTWVGSYSNNYKEQP